MGKLRRNKRRARGNVENEISLMGRYHGRCLAQQQRKDVKDASALLIGQGFSSFFFSLFCPSAPFSYYCFVLDQRHVDEVIR